MSETASERSLGFLIILAIMMILALALPFAYHVDVGPGPDSIRAMTWDYIESTWYTGFRFWNPLDTLPYTILRLVFAFYLASACLGNVTAKKAILIGILAELQPIIVSAPLVYFIEWSGDPLIPLYIPIPTLLVIGTIIVLIIKRKYAKY